MRNSAKAFRSVRLDNAAIDKIIDELDHADGGVDLGRRDVRRFRFHAKGAVIHLLARGAPPKAFVAHTRTISDTGLNFLHGAFIHSRSKCIVSIKTLNGMWRNIGAEIVRSDYVTNGVHDVAVRFLEEIHAFDFCAEAMPCKVLLADESPASVRAATVLLENMNTDVTPARNGDRAIKLATESIFDVVLIDMNISRPSGFEAVAQLRAAGYTGIIVGLVSASEPDETERCLAAGCDDHVLKPLSKEKLSGTLMRARQSPIQSVLAADRDMAPLIDGFIQSIQQHIRNIEATSSAGVAEALARTCRDLKGEAGGVGFSSISVAASEVEQAIYDSRTADEVAGAVSRLMNLCRRARGLSSQSATKTGFAPVIVQAPRKNTH